MTRHMESFLRRQIWVRRLCYGFFVLASAAIFALMSFQSVQVAPPDHSSLGLPTDMVPDSWRSEGPSSAAELRIDDVISFGSEVLCLVRIPPSFHFPNNEKLECRYGNTRPHQKVLAVHLWRPFLAAVVCGTPPRPQGLTSVLIKLDTHQEIRVPKGLAALPWNSTKVVYEVYSTDHDVALFVHGFNQTLGFDLSQFQCVYGDGTGQCATAVTAQANEVFRCGHPPKAKISTFTNQKMSLRFDGKILPSFAYYNPPPKQLSLSKRKKEVHHICACTMIYNGAKFLREWVYYHSHLGVEKFIIYDNNSEDNLDEVIAKLAISFNVTKQSWPWVKTQQAALSHCSLLARHECTWMLFSDIDEYFFPSERFLNASSLPNASPSVSILATFIEEFVTLRAKQGVQVGQIGTYCRNFGPSGLRVSPPEGVTQGYTCRVQRQRRHKSIVMLNAIADSLGNQVHHFTLKPPYAMEQIRPWVAIINHYKFQVWEEFKTKFRRRAATYVADWTEDRNHGSNDRVPGLGTKPIKPADWESRYCEVQDHALKDYTRRIFGSQSKRGGKVHLAWE